MEDAHHPLLTPRDEDPHNTAVKSHSAKTSTKAFTSSFAADHEGDIQQVNGLTDFSANLWAETMKLWYLAGPAIFTVLCQYGYGALSQIFAGHVGTLQLAALSIENLVIAGFAYGSMMGMGSALETLCGQAYGAGQIDMLGIYLQRSWVILLTSALPMLFLYIFAEQILRLIGQTPDLSKWAGTYSIWMIPQLFAMALNYPIQKFLQAQSKIMAMAVISGVAVLAHAIFSWLFMLKLGWGMAGGAVVLNATWWFIVIGQLVYIFTGTCGAAWSGFSFKAFQNLGGFVKLSLASAVMLCLEMWYYNALVLFAGYVDDAEVGVSAFSICFNVLGWVTSLGFGLNAAISVRVSNELGASHPGKAKFSVFVATIYALIVGLFFSFILIITRHQYPTLFSSSEEVQKVVSDLTPLLCVSLVVNVLQPTLSGVAIGAGWQAYVAYVNVVSYYVFGLPLGLVMGYVFGMGVEGIWFGMLSGTAAQTIILIWVLCTTNWDQEAANAGQRVKLWGGDQTGTKPSDSHTN